METTHRQPDDPVEAVGFAVRMAGDTDTIATMAGARSGAAAFPRLWRERVENGTSILALVDRLAALAIS